MAERLIRILVDVSKSVAKLTDSNTGELLFFRRGESLRFEVGLMKNGVVWNPPAGHNFTLEVRERANPQYVPYLSATGAIEGFVSSTSAWNSGSQQNFVATFTDAENVNTSSGERWLTIDIADASGKVSGYAGAVLVQEPGSQSFPNGGQFTGVRFIQETEKAATDGVATLDSSGQVPLQQLPFDADLVFKGTWDASTNSPDAAVTLTTAGDFLEVAVAGTSSVTGSPESFGIRDKVVFNGTALERVPYRLVDKPQASFADRTERESASASFAGQVGVTVSNGSTWKANTTAAGDWSETGVVYKATVTELLSDLDHEAGIRAHVGAASQDALIYEKTAAPGSGSWTYVAESVTPPMRRVAAAGDGRVDASRGSAVSGEPFRLLRDQEVISVVSGVFDHAAFGGVTYVPTSGTLVAAWRLGEEHTGGGESGLAIRRSNDLGATWSAQEIWKQYPAPPGSGAGTDLRDVEITTAADGTVFMNWSEVIYTDGLSTGVRVHVARSTDGGMTFAEVSQISGPEYNYAATTTKIVELPGGELLMSVYSLDLSDQTNYTKWKVWCFRSLDRGRTWTGHEIDDDGRLTETSLAYYDGRLMAFVRDDGDTVLYRYESTDGGVTWGSRTDVTPPQGWQPTRPALIVLAGGAMAMSARRESAATPPRIYTTHDFGDTWESSFLEHDTRRLTYHSFTLLPGGSVGMIWSWEQGATGVMNFGEIAIGNVVDSQGKGTLSGLETRSAKGKKEWTPEIASPPEQSAIRALFNFDVRSREIGHIFEEKSNLAITHFGGSTPSIISPLEGPKGCRAVLDKIGGNSYLEVGGVTDFSWMHQAPMTWTLGVSVRLDATDFDDDRALFFSTSDLGSTSAGVSLFLDNRDSVVTDNWSLLVGDGTFNRINTGHASAIPFGQWTSYIVVLDGTSAYFYVGGELIGISALGVSEGAAADSSTLMRIGADPGNAINGSFRMGGLVVLDTGDLANVEDVHAYLMR